MRPGPKGPFFGAASRSLKAPAPSGKSSRTNPCSLRKCAGPVYLISEPEGRVIWAWFQGVETPCSLRKKQTPCSFRKCAGPVSQDLIPGLKAA